MVRKETMMKNLLIILLFATKAFSFSFGIEYSGVPINKVGVSSIQEALNEKTDYLLSMNIGNVDKDMFSLKFMYLNYTKENTLSSHYVESRLTKSYAILVGKDINLFKVNLFGSKYQTKVVPFIGVLTSDIVDFVIWRSSSVQKTSYTAIEDRYDYSFSMVYSLTFPLRGFQCSYTYVPNVLSVMSFGFGF